MGKRPSAPPAPCGRVRVCVWSVGALSIPWKLLDRFRAETLDFFSLSLSLSLSSGEKKSHFIAGNSAGKRQSAELANVCARPFFIIKFK